MSGPKKSQKLMNNHPPMREYSIKKNHPPMREYSIKKNHLPMIEYSKTSLFENILLWDIRRLLFSNVLEYSKTSLFAYSFSFQNVLIDRTAKILLLATKLTTFPNNHEKQAERCFKIHTLVIDASDEFHNVRARRTLAGDSIEKWSVIDYFYIYIFFWIEISPEI